MDCSLTHIAEEQGYVANRAIRSEAAGIPWVALHVPNLN